MKKKNNLQRETFKLSEENIIFSDKSTSEQYTETDSTNETSDIDNTETDESENNNIFIKY